MALTQALEQVVREAYEYASDHKDAFEDIKQLLTSISAFAEQRVEHIGALNRTDEQSYAAGDEKDTPLDWRNVTDAATLHHISLNNARLLDAE